MSPVVLLVRRMAFVGEQAGLATEYHEGDFDWEQHRDDVKDGVLQQTAAWKLQYEAASSYREAAGSYVAPGSKVADDHIAARDTQSQSCRSQADVGSTVVDYTQVDRFGVIVADSRDARACGGTQAQAGHVQVHSSAEVSNGRHGDSSPGEPMEGSAMIGSALPGVHMDGHITPEACTMPCDEQLSVTTVPASGDWDGDTGRSTMACDEQLPVSTVPASGDLDGDTGRSRKKREKRRQRRRERRAQGAAAGRVADPRDFEYTPRSWEAFHLQHKTARFFKERRYLQLEFPALAVSDPPQHFVEIGCGCGSSAIPVLSSNTTCRMTLCDVSETAVQLLKRAAEDVGIEEHRVHAFPWDATHISEPARNPSHANAEFGERRETSHGQERDPHPSEGLQEDGRTEGAREGSIGDAFLRPALVKLGIDPQPEVKLAIDPQPEEDCGDVVVDGVVEGPGQTVVERHPLTGLEADGVLLIFTLSALAPHDMHSVLQSAWDCLRPGGLLMFRDYGLYDLPQLRFPVHQQLGESLYRRADGTLAYFFSLEDIRGRVEKVGFAVEECRYACVAVVNRKTQEHMKRVFVHGLFRKPVQVKRVG